VIAALAFGTAPLLHYDTTSHPPPTSGPAFRVLEWAYGCPIPIIMLLAKINSWRVSRWMEQPTDNLVEWQEIEERVQKWIPAIDLDQSANVVARFAIHEGWRQAVLIYLYMVSALSQ
jgi:hypothetical protein